MTVALACGAFVSLLIAIWVGGGEDDWVWRVWGCLALAALAASHASLVTGARRPHDSEAVRVLATISIGLGAIDSLAGILPLADLLEVEEGAAQVVAVLVIALLLTTALPPILRRLQGTAPAAPPSSSGLADEVIAAADRIERLGDGNLQINQECERLRGLARSAAR